MFCELNSRVDSLEKDLKNQKIISEAYIERDISDDEAKKDIINYIKEIKSKGNTKISMIDLVTNINLPSEQIERIMEDLEGSDV
jgi:hypothetical protein